MPPLDNKTFRTLLKLMLILLDALFLVALTPVLILAPDAACSLRRRARTTLMSSTTVACAKRCAARAPGKRYVGWIRTSLWYPETILAWAWLLSLSLASLSKPNNK